MVTWYWWADTLFWQVSIDHTVACNYLSTRVKKTCSAGQSKLKLLTFKLQSLPAHNWKAKPHRSIKKLSKTRSKFCWKFWVTQYLRLAYLSLIWKWRVQASLEPFQLLRLDVWIFCFDGGRLQIWNLPPTSFFVVLVFMHSGFHETYRELSKKTRKRRMAKRQKKIMNTICVMIA